MQLTFQNEFKSIRHLPASELPDFTVITGANGAGKTHLLQALVNGSLRVPGIEPDKIKYYNWTDLVPPDTQAVQPRQIENQRNATCQTIAEICAAYEEQIITWIRQHSSGSPISVTKQQLQEAALLPAPQSIDVEAGGNNARQVIFQWVTQAREQLLQALIQGRRDGQAYFHFHDEHNQSRFNKQLNAGQAFVFSQMVANSRKPFFALTLEECFSLYPLASIEQDPFIGSLTDLFASYVGVRSQNATNKALTTDFGTETPFLTKEDFLQRYGLPPWEVFNQVLAEAKLSFRFQEPSPDASRPLQLQLRHTVADVEVKFADLSSGERVLISLAHFLFFSQDPRQPTAMPELILLDEVDAPLHPSMTVSLLNTIQQVMVGRYGRKVVLATHSPSTVALAPEESIHVLDVETKLLRKASRDEAVQVLTVGVPTLSINLANRRQVFVESRNDEEFYGRIATIAQTHLLPGISLTFIASGHEEGGGCDRVKKLVSQLTGAGNASVYGIIDWDGTNASTTNLRVLGEGVRHSIENYLLDPVLLGALLLREKLMEREQLGLVKGETYVDLRGFDDARLQTLVDGVLVAISFTPAPANELTTVRYLNGRSVKVPTAYLCMRGHTLEDNHVKVAFPKLKGFRKDADLKKTMLEKVLDDVPGLLPFDFVTLLLAIQRSH